MPYSNFDVPDVTGAVDAVWAFLDEPVTIHINSFPPFAFEAFLALTLVAVYVYLHLEVSNIARKTLTLRPNTVTRACYDGTASRCSSWLNKIRTPVPDSLCCGDVASMTPSEYVKKEKERRMRERDLGGSLSALYDDVVGRKYSEETLRTRLELAKEDVRCAAYLGGDLTPAALTTSLFDLLEKVASTGSIGNCFSYKGDVTRLILEAGNLNEELSGNAENCFSE